VKTISFLFHRKQNTQLNKQTTKQNKSECNLNLKPMDSRDFLLEECQEVPPQVAASESPVSSTTVEDRFNPSDFKEAPKGKQLKAKGWFLTFPRTDTTKELAMSRLQFKFKESLSGVLICQEQHKDGE